MPYIKQKQRDELDLQIEDLVSAIKELRVEEQLSDVSGVLNYTISSIILRTLPSIKYTELNKVVGALECAKLELYRRVLSPKEDRAVENNGDLPEIEELLSE